MLTAALPLRSDPSRLYVVMGVAGCGKTSIGRNVAEHIGGTFMDGDDFHPRSNIEKMSNGQALEDADRWPWLEIIAKEMAARDGIVLAGCSALKRRYRDFITKKAGEPVTFIYLKGSKELVAGRMSSRQGHFMPTSLLDSQFDTLEEPDNSENAFAVSIDGPQSAIIETISTAIREMQGR